MYTSFHSASQVSWLPSSQRRPDTNRAPSSLRTEPAQAYSIVLAAEKSRRRETYTMPPSFFACNVCPAYSWARHVRHQFSHAILSPASLLSFTASALSPLRAPSASGMHPAQHTQHTSKASTCDHTSHLVRDMSVAHTLCVRKMFYELAIRFGQKPRNTD